jgi:hypothetical protein
MDQQLGVAVPIKLRDVPVGALRLIVPRRTWNLEMAAALDSIKEGGLTASMNVIPREMGCQLINDIIVGANGGTVPKIHDIKVHTTDKTNVDEDMKAFQ